MSRIRKLNVSQINGNNADTDNTDEIRPYGEMALYQGEYDQSSQQDRLELAIHDGKRTHLKSKVLGPGRLYGAGADSGDGNGLDTIKLIPDASLHYNGGSYGNDQYIVVDPTFPNHIHLRAGGTQDSSNANLFLGGEKNYVRVSDGSDNVVISTDDNNTGTKQWTFGGDGKLVLPGDAYSNTPASIYNSNYAIRLYPTYNGITGLGPEMSVYYDDALVISANTNDFSTLNGTRVVALRLMGATASGSMESGRVFIDSGYHNNGGSKGSVNLGTQQATEINVGNTNAKLIVKSKVPDASVGAIGDKAGAVAFSSGYIYYCTADYVPNEYTTIVALPGLSIDTVPVAKGNYPTPTLAWSVTISGETLGITNVVDGGDSWILTVPGMVSSGGAGIQAVLNTGEVLANIWKRVAWSGDTW